MTLWGRKGAAAARSGRFAGADAAWKAAKGKPKQYVSGSSVIPGRHVSGKYVAAREYFLEGYWSVPNARANPRGRGRHTTRATGSGALIPAKLKRMPNGTYKVYVAPGQMVKLRGVNPRSRNGRSYVRKGVSIGVPRHAFDPRAGDKFYIMGKSVTIKRREGDYVYFKGSVDGTTAMSVSNLYQVAYAPEDSRFAGYR